MEQSVFVRKRKLYNPDDDVVVESGSIYAVENGEVIIDENGNEKFVLREPVSPSLAAEFSVSSNALRSRGNVVSLGRENIDPVDAMSRAIDIVEQ